MGAVACAIIQQTSIGGDAAILEFQIERRTHFSSVHIGENALSAAALAQSAHAGARSEIIPHSVSPFDALRKSVAP